MIELSLTLLILAFGLTVIGIIKENSFFTFISAFVFLLLGFTSENTWIMILMIGIFAYQIFNTFFPVGRGY